jgi:uncharacterized membrane protein YbhN (UPF0104 family)
VLQPIKLLSLSLGSPEIIVFKGLLSSVGILLLAGCSTAASPETRSLLLPMVQQLDCSSPAGVTLEPDQLTLRIALGRRPTSGYGVQVVQQQVDGTRIHIAFEEQKPKGMAAQVLTSPCVRIALPDDWQQLNVRDQQHDLDWKFVRQ